jgi:hypothetical protein
MTSSAGVRLLATNVPLMRHGERLAFVGFLMAMAFFLISRAGVADRREGLARGRLLAMRALVIPLVVVGCVGLGMMAVATR